MGQDLSACCQPEIEYYQHDISIEEFARKAESGRYAVLTTTRLLEPYANLTCSDVAVMARRSDIADLYKPFLLKVPVVDTAYETLALLFCKALGRPAAVQRELDEIYACAQCRGDAVRAESEDEDESTRKPAAAEAWTAVGRRGRHH